MSSTKKYYNSHGKPYSINDFIELEVNERGNYDIDEVERWKEKYHLTNDSKLIWVANKPAAALTYILDSESHDDIDLPLDEFLNKWDLTQEYVDLLNEYTEDDGTIIQESDDGDGGFLMVLKKESESKYSKGGIVETVTAFLNKKVTLEDFTK